MTGGGKYFQCRSDSLRPFGHDVQADVCFVEKWIVLREAVTIVAHLKSPLRLLLNIKPDTRGSGVFACVCKRLLHHMQYLQLQIGCDRDTMPLHR